MAKKKVDTRTGRVYKHPHLTGACGSEKTL